MAAFNAVVHQWPGIPYYSIAGDADADGNGIIQGDEWKGFPFTDFLATIDYEALGRTTSLPVTETSLAWGIVKYNFAPAVLSDTVAPNDLVSTEASTHCTACGFQTLATYKLNHLALKNATTTDLIVSTISQQYPVR